MQSSSRACETCRNKDSCGLVKSRKIILIEPMVAGLDQDIGWIKGT